MDRSPGADIGYASTVTERARATHGNAETDYTDAAYGSTRAATRAQGRSYPTQALNTDTQSRQMENYRTFQGNKPTLQSF